ncbi:diguanylate cyclase [Aquabacter cavernae]|uniref:diguanylate cyclase n=1 Tax=Aquabacter cavernae TaxID=2496029 RepID=UPI000F8D74C8|nr:diguanylate cyclase [Aquabacter cavernae]
MRVVLVEPGKVGLKLMSRMIEEMGHVVSPFTDGTGALAYLHSGADIDVLMTSFEIEGVSGIQLCWEARTIADGGRPIYVIAMSSSNDSAHLVEALDSGADDFIRKPPDRIELDARLRAAARLVQARRDLVRLATRDSLTGLLNRRAYFTEAEALIRAGGPASVLLFDIDYFKRINDTFGHDGGDAVLVAVARAAADLLGCTARIGGEEFAALLPGRSEDDAFAEAERLRALIAGMTVGLPDGRMTSVTVSLGVAQNRPGQNADAWLKQADIALYAAKTGGRDRAVKARQAVTAGAPGTASGIVRAESRAARPT